MSKNFITSDLHLGHERVIQYSSRPFVSEEDMRDKLIQEINSLPSGSTLYVIGDTTIGNKEHRVREILQRLNPNIKYVWVLGNHDHRMDKVYAEFGEVHRLLEIKHNGIKIVMCHFPMYEWNQGNYGAIHVYGHTHGLFKKMGKAIDVGWDAHGKILTLEEAIDIADKKIIYQPCHNKNNGLYREEIGVESIGKLIRWWRLLKDFSKLYF